jgi:hypothetical protein
MSRQIAHGTVWFPEPVKARILDLMKAQSSAARSAYQAIHKHGLKGNAVKQRVKCNFMALKLKGCKGLSRISQTHLTTA